MYYMIIMDVLYDFHEGNASENISGLSIYP